MLMSAGEATSRCTDDDSAPYRIMHFLSVVQAETLCHAARMSEHYETGPRNATSMSYFKQDL